MGKMLKSTKHVDAKMAWAKLMPFQNINVIQGQYFDNAGKEDKAGNPVPDAIKLMIWNRAWNINPRLNDYDWHRVIQLLEPASVIRWAKAKHKIGEMTPSELETYVAFNEGVKQLNPDEFKLIKMGHIDAPSDLVATEKCGQYHYVGQFIVFTVDQQDNANLIIAANNDVLHLGNWGHTRIKNKLTKKNAAKLAVWYDPNKIVNRQLNTSISAPIVGPSSPATVDLVRDFAKSIPF